MIKTLSILLLFILFGLFVIPQPVQAIIILPAIILLPVAKIVGLVIGAFALPSLGLSAIYAKLFKVSLRRTVIVTIVLLLLVAVILGIFLKFENPLRPLV